MNLSKSITGFMHPSMLSPGECAQAEISWVLQDIITRMPQFQLVLAETSKEIQELFNNGQISAITVLNSF